MIILDILILVYAKTGEFVIYQSAVIPSGENAGLPPGPA